MNSTTITRMIGIVCVGYTAYQWWGIPGIVLVVGLALCNKL